MSLVISNPLDKFYKSYGKAPVKTLRVASPFITGPGIKSLVGQFRKKRTRIQIITNLSELNVALSLSNPVAPLLEIMKALADRVEIRSHPMLHAKLYLVEGRTALLGSSNLTFGGMERNAELNWLVKGRKDDDRKQLELLAHWYQQLWENAGTGLSKQQLLNIEKIWEENQKRLMGVVGTLIPEPRLGGDYWGKVRTIASRKTWKMKAISDLLSEKDESIAKNTNRKLIFLKNLGLIEFDEKEVQVLRKVSSHEEMFNLLDDGHLELSLRRILQSFQGSDSKRMSFKTFSEDLGIDANDVSLHAAILWLESLEYISRHQPGGDHQFAITKKAKELNIG